ncbi:alpha/beta hydrolase [Lysobacter sp. F6437]|uniref:alpha/beta hydrolase n=1 Tax=Lysobacter sp. F6437 TaxID=3459296 RepID=UPI00403DABC8
MNLQVRIPPVAAAAVNAANETAHCFGDGLVGVLTRPRTGRDNPVAVILLNAGLVHRVGPFRGYVQLARVLADQGFAVLRFDQSGLGDSPLCAVASGQRRQREVGAAMALLADETGADRFVLAGICSGADDAFHVAVDDARVAGFVLLDGLAYRTWGYWLHHLLPRLLDPGRLWRRLRQPRVRKPAAGNFRDFPGRADAVKQMAALVARDVRMLFLFTGGAYGYFNHPRQLVACLGRAARSSAVGLEHWPDCDHTFYLRRDRARLQRTVAAWMRGQFG